MGKKKGRKGGGCKLTALMVLTALVFVPSVLALNTEPEKKTEPMIATQNSAVNSEPSVKKVPVLTPVDLDSRIKTLTDQREKLSQAGQKNLEQGKAIEQQFIAVTGAIQVLQDMKKTGTEPKKDESNK